jgi:hypothetical protein
MLTLTKMIVNVYFDHSNGKLALSVLILLWCCWYDVHGGQGVVLWVSCIARSYVLSSVLQRATSLCTLSDM